MLKLSKQQKAVLVGTILGDGYLQTTGAKNARIRLEHSAKQKDYLFWKWQQLGNLFSKEPQKMVRFNPVFGKKYEYFRCQSNSTPTLGKLRSVFYDSKIKIIPKNLAEYLTPLSLAVWFMDDGYYYHRDKVAYLYLPDYAEEDIETLEEVLKELFALEPRFCRKKGKKGGNFYFPVNETQKLFSIIAPYIIESMRYKILFNPVSTERNFASAKE